PAPVDEDPSAQDRCADRGERVQATKHAEGGAPAVFWKEAGDESQTLGCEQPAADPLEDSSPDQLPRVLGEAAGGGSKGEEGETCGEDVALPEAVAEPARWDEEYGVDEQVGVDHPEHLVERGAEVTDDRGHRDVDDGGVEQDREEADADHRKREPGVGLT